MVSPSDKALSNKMWGGRFAEAPDAIMEEINASIGFDQRLYRQDIAGSKAHATMLEATGILTREDRDAILRRRKRFIAIALSSAAVSASLAGCQPCLSPLQPDGGPDAGPGDAGSDAGPSDAGSDGGGADGGGADDGGVDDGGAVDAD